MHVMDYYLLPGYLGFFIIGLMLLATQNKRPKSFEIVCSACGEKGRAVIKKSCNTLGAFVLLVLLPPISVIYQLVTRNRHRVYCGSCNGLCGVIRPRYGYMQLAGGGGVEDGAPAVRGVGATAATVCSNCERPIGKLESAYRWGEHVVCANCLKLLSEQRPGGA